MAKNNISTKIKTITFIVVLLTIGAGIVARSVTNTGDIGNNAKAIGSHAVEDKARDTKAHEDINELEKKMIGVGKDITYIQQDIADIKDSIGKQETLMIEIVKALPK